MVRLGEFHMTPLLVRVAAFLAAQFTGATSAQVVFVDWQAAPGGDGSSWSDAFASLDDALDAAGSGAELWVRRGTYQPGSLFGRDSTFEVPGGGAVFGEVYFAGRERLTVWGFALEQGLEGGFGDVAG